MSNRNLSRAFLYRVLCCQNIFWINLAPEVCDLQISCQPILVKRWMTFLSAKPRHCDCVNIANFVILVRAVFGIVASSYRQSKVTLWPRIADIGLDQWRFGVTSILRRKRDHW